MERKDDFNIDDPPVWKCLLKGGEMVSMLVSLKIVTGQNV